MALKIRIMASAGRLTGKGKMSPVSYRAEAYRDTDRYRETVWGCAHDHTTVEDALHCGYDWMVAQLKSA